MLVCAAACVLVLSACGQKGDLYLPNTKQTIEGGHAGHEKDNFLVPDIKNRIKDVQNNPNSF